MKTVLFGYRIGLLVVLAVLLLGCQDDPSAEDDVRLEVVVDGTRTTYTYDRIASVGQVLAAYDIEVSPLDEVNPRQFTQISDGMVITITRVTEDEDCVDEVLSYEVNRFNTTNLQPGVIEVAEAGTNGIERVCYRVVYRDGVEFSRVLRDRIVLQASINRVEYVGVEDTIDPVPINGTLAYIAGGQAYLMQTSSSLRRPLTTEGGLDGRVFDLSSEGRQLLFTRQTTDPADEPFNNELWVILDTRTNEPSAIQTAFEDVLTAQWRPGTPYTFAYSNATPASNVYSGWSADNDLHIARLNSQTGEIITPVDTIIEENLAGLFPAWGTRFVWSPDGQRMAYAKADGIGLVDFAAGILEPTTINFPHFESSIASNWVWQPTISWSEDSQWIVTTVHGDPFADESPTNSIIFDIAVWKLSDNLVLDGVIAETGIWSTPAYSPITTVEVSANTRFQEFQIAYLQARAPYNSVSTEYDLVVADRDGSNPRVLFPGTSLRGIRPIDGNGEFVWSPDGTQIAIVYQNDLWLLNVRSGIAQRITNEGPVRAPRWVE